MKAEAAAFLDKAREFFAKAEDTLADDWPGEAGRAKPAARCMRGRVRR